MGPLTLRQRYIVPETMCVFSLSSVQYGYRQQIVVMQTAELVFTTDNEVAPTIIGHIGRRRTNQNSGF